MTKKALFPGSFDPFTSGHEAIVRRALALFDEIYIAIGVNTEKQYMFSTDQREKKIRQFFPNDNHSLDPQIETILFMADNEHRDISSTLAREQLTHPKQ